MTFTKKDWSLVDELAAVKRENRRLKHIEDSIEAMFDLGNGHKDAGIRLSCDYWAAIQAAAIRSA